MSKLEVMAIDGTMEERNYVLPTFKAEVDKEIQTYNITVCAGLIQSFETVNRGYTTALPFISKMIKAEMWKNFEGIKGINALVENLTGCSKATASEMIKVATKFYTSGVVDERFLFFEPHKLELEPEEVEQVANLPAIPEKIAYKFTYSDLIRMSKLDNDELESFLAKCQKFLLFKAPKLGEHKRKDIDNIVKEIAIESAAAENEKTGSVTSEVEIELEPENGDSESSKPKDSSAEPSENDGNDSSEPELLIPDAEGFHTEETVFKSLVAFESKFFDKDVTKLSKTELQEQLYQARKLIREVADFLNSPEETNN